ncbi:MAG: serine hydrolase [Deltaproteobacteria bacterium]
MKRTIRAQIFLVSVFAGLLLFSISVFTTFASAQQPVSYTISGSVKHLATQVSLNDIIITVKDVSGGQTAGVTTSDPSGNYSLSLLSPRTYTLLASKTGYLDSSPPDLIELTDTSPNKVVNLFMESEVASLSLSAGWNFISFPQLPSSPASIETVLKDVSPKVRIVWGYDNVNKVWLKYSPNLSLRTPNSLDKVEYGKGYWIYMDAPGTINLTSWLPPSIPTIQLYAGWNLIGYNGPDNTDVLTALSGISGKWSILWNWQNGQWYGKHTAIVSLPSPIQALSAFNRSRAYWIRAKTDTPVDPGQAKNGEIIRYYEALTDTLVSNNKVPGLIAGVWAPDQNLTWVKAKGKASIASGDLMKDYYQFRIGSITKTFTYTVLLQLADKGLLNLDDKLSTYFPDFPNAGNVTIRMICNHTSGIYNYNKSAIFTSQMITNPLKVWDPQEFLNIARDQPYYFSPGTGYEYSNTNTVMAGMIVEKITGNKIEYEIKKRIIEKLGMNNTYYPVNNLFPGQHSNGYGWWGFGDSKADVTEAFDPSCAGASGAIVSDIYDLKTWIEAAVNGTLLSPAMQSQRLTPVNSTEIVSYGLGLGSINTGSSGFVWGHTGVIYGYRSVAYYWPAKNVTIVISFNTVEDDPSLLLFQMLDRL